MNNNPIGVFDSGLGGLTVVKAIQDLLPNESVIYLGDTARVPYGNKSQQTIKKYSFQIADFLIENGAKIIVIACNTASALAIEDVKKYVEIPVVGVIEPGVETAINSTRNKQIGVIGTTATIRSMEYEKKTKDSRSGRECCESILSVICPLGGRRLAGRNNCRRHCKNLSKTNYISKYRYSSSGVYTLSTLKTTFTISNWE